MGRTLAASRKWQPTTLYYYIQEFIVAHSASLWLFGYRLVPCLHDIPQDGSSYPPSATIIPIRTGIVRDIRNQLYQKITSLSLGQLAKSAGRYHRPNGGVREVENSIMSSLDMLFRIPAILSSNHHTHLHQLAAHPLHHLFVPPFGWFVGVVGKN